MEIIEILIKELIKNRVKSPADLAFFKRKAAKKYKIACPSNIELLKAYHKITEEGRIKKTSRTENLLKTRPIRSLSGIVNISVLTKPYPCPGKCIYCPMEKGIPKSYLSGEPAVERAKKLNYNPYLQVQKRIEMLNSEGHPTDKIELRIVGGTWSFYPKKYQIRFIKECFRAANQHKKSYQKQLKTGTMVLISSWLKGEQKKNERAKHRVVGLSIETRPDFINEREIKILRGLGVTKFELGVQSIFNNILKLNQRGHGVEATIGATKLLKDAGFKVSYQMMLNLPGSSPSRDARTFEELFKNPDFKPDLLKIYPLSLVKEAPLHKLWKAKKYKPYSYKTLISLIKNIKKKIPRYVRVERIVRDIPAPRIISGPTKISNLRQVIEKERQKEGWKCKCVRCREVKEDYSPKEKLYFFREDYNASGGKEILLSFEDKNREKLYSLLRIRFPSPIFSLPEARPRAVFPVLKEAAIIREVHTYGQLIPVSERRIAPQHKGLGKKLIKEAEKITKKEFGLKKIAVISAAGVRDYFRRLGYRLKDTYMIKNL